MVTDMISPDWSSASRLASGKAVLIAFRAGARRLGAGQRGTETPGIIHANRGSAPVMLRRTAPATLAVSMLLALTFLYLGGYRGLYHEVLVSWGVEPWAFPFLDTDTILSALRCRRLGVDVFVTNPCDPIGRVYDYSPLWLAGAALPVTINWITPVGLAFVALFTVALFLLPPGRGAKETALIALGVLSTASAFAVERGNNDLVIFALSALTAWLARRSPGIRLLGYSCALAAGLLKYYPLTLLALITREPARRLLLVGPALALALASAILIDRDELERALRLVPTGSYFGLMFGAKMLPGGLAQVFGMATGAIPFLEAALSAGAVTLGILLGKRLEVRADLDSLSESERLFLFAGCALLIGCFFSAQNISYRSIHLILLLPALTALVRLSPYRALYRLSTAIALLLLWSELWRRLLYRVWAELALPGVNTMQFGLWLLRETSWWWLLTMLLALLTALLLRYKRCGATV